MTIDLNYLSRDDSLNHHFFFEFQKEASPSMKEMTVGQLQVIVSFSIGSIF